MAILHVELHGSPSTCKDPVSRGIVRTYHIVPCAVRPYGRGQCGSMRVSTEITDARDPYNRV